MLIPGIDAGNSRFKVAIPDAAGKPQLLTNRFGEPFTSSVVYFSEDGTIIVGTEAANASLANPERAVFDWKRHMGTGKILYTAEDGTTYTAENILSILLKFVKEDIEAKTGEVVNEVTITDPANYTDVQKQRTIDAAAEANLSVLLLLHEPTAAALGNGLHLKKDGLALIFDLGGGTFDVSIIKNHGNVCEVIATGGKQKLGGQDFNKRMEEKILDQFEVEHNYRPNPDKHPIFFQDVIQRTEQFKVSLSVQEQTKIALACEGDLLTMTITRDQFESWVMDLAQETMKQTEQIVRDAKLDWANIDEIYAVGGGSMMPIIKKLLEQTTGKKLSQKCEPHCAAALGAVIAGRLECERQGKTYMIGNVTLPPPEFFMRDILSRPIGILVLDEKDKEICFEMLTKNVPIPSIQTKMFKLAEANQTEVCIKVLDGEHGADVSNCVLLGYFELKDLPPRPDLIGRIEITFDLNASGMLTAIARDIVSGKNAELVIDYKNNENSKT